VKKSILAVAALCFATAAAQAAEPAEGPFGKAGVSDQTMAQMRGGTEAQNNAIGVGGCNGLLACQVNGVSEISGNAFSGAAGVITVIQNTGANVILQNATVVNVNIH
jgi:hypothetical protein